MFAMLDPTLLVLKNVLPEKKKKNFFSPIGPDTFLYTFKP